MARFELDDGNLRKFWEVELEGEVLTFRFGDLGSPGRERTKRHRSERSAKAAFHEAVRAMRSQGYERVLVVPSVPKVAGSPEWSRLEADPDDAVALAVHSDWLMGNGDVRGEVIALELADQPGEAERLRVENTNALLGGSVDFPGEMSLQWTHGYVSEARFDRSDHGGADPEDAALALLARPALRLLRRLEIRLPSAIQVVLACDLPALRELSVHTGMVSMAFEGSVPLDLDRLASRAPRLSALRVRGVTELVGRGAVPALTGLDVRYAPGWIERIVRDGGALESLGVHGCDIEAVRALSVSGRVAQLASLSLTPAWNAPLVEVTAALGRGRCAPLLHLDSVDVEAADARALVRLPGLEVLAIAGTVTETARRILADSHVELTGTPRVRDDDEDDEDEPVRPDDLAVQRFEKARVKHPRFWEIGCQGSVHFVRYGRLGHRGRWIWRRFPSADDAAEMMERRIEEKLREGYLRSEVRIIAAGHEV